MFINFSNHPSIRWSGKQKQAAAGFGEVCDIKFPEVPSMATTEEVARLADRCVGEILRMSPDCVMCQGEFSLAMAVIERLQAAGVRCVCACSERKVIEEQLDDGTMRKTSVFEFRQFREYDRPNHI